LDSVGSGVGVTFARTDGGFRARFHICATEVDPSTDFGTFDPGVSRVGSGERERKNGERFGHFLECFVLVLLMYF
jgi:hypothetical protein